MAEYAWHGTALESPFVTIESNFRVSVLCDVQWDSYKNSYNVLIEGVRLEKVSGKHLFIPHDFIEDMLEASLEDLAEWIKPKFEEYKMDMIDGPEYDHEAELLERDEKVI